jgi:arylsulfatase
MAEAQTQRMKPNVVFILVDNLGWGDLGCFGGANNTRNIDALAAAGMRLKNYNIEAQCTPSRSAILTGRMPIRTGCSSVPLPGQGNYGLAPWEYTIGELFSDAGYATALYGKWHVGDVEGRLPTDQGFDEWFGIKNTSDEAAYTSYPLFAATGQEPPKIWEGVKGSPSHPADDFNLETRPLMDEKITNRTIEFIRRNAAAKKPFFVYVGFTQLHAPLIPHPAFKSKSGGGNYSDAVTELDFRTGQILTALDKAGATDNTIVVWSSDNAAIDAESMGGSNGPWRGWFSSGFEGGMRVPAIVRWPGRTPVGVTDEIVAAVDWLPTLASLVGESKRVPTDRPIDGVDSSDLLLGRSQKSNRDYFIFYGSDGELMSAKWRNYKVVFRYAEKWDGPFIKRQLPMTFDLINDPHEDRNLSDARMDNGWMMKPVMDRIIALHRSMAQYPNVKTGEDFQGYKQPDRSTKTH